MESSARIQTSVESADENHVNGIPEDRRSEPRHLADSEARVTDLARLGHSASAKVRDISESGICVVMPLQLAAGDIVRLDVADSVLFGLVASTVAEGPGWRTGIEVQRVLLGESELSQFLHQILRRTMPAVAVGPRL